MPGLIRELEREAARRLPRPPGILVPGWFWQEWVLVAIVIATSIGITFVVWGTLT